MKTSGQFTLFETTDEFKQWLFNTNFTRNITRIQHHHTFSPNYSSFNGSNHFALLIGMRDYHIKTNGWSDIGQNVTVFPDGTIAICRSFEKDPAGIKGANTGAICVENLGNFDSEVMTEEQKKSIIAMTALCAIRFKWTVDTNSIIYHHWFDQNTGARTNGTGVTKTCPGIKFFGGNTIEACQNNFLPLVRNFINEYNKPITIEEVINMFKDDANISQWAKESVYNLKEKGIISGDNLGNFNPKDPLTREALAVVICNLLKYLGK